MSINLRLNPPGFGLIGIIIAVSVIGLLTGGGLYFKEVKTQKSQIQKGLELEKKVKELRDKITEQNIKLAKEAGLEGNKSVKSASQLPQKPVEVIDTSTWKTYRNEKYGFEFKYNKALVLDNSVYVDKEVSLVSRYTFTDKDDFGFDVDVFENISHLKLKEWYMKVLNGKEFSIGPGLKTFEKESNLKDELINNGGIMAISISTNLMDTIQERLFFSNGRYIVRFGRSYVSDDTSEYEKGLFQETINTIKFIEPIDISTWKTYRNDKYGFEVRYPAEWQSGEEESAGESYIYFKTPQRETTVDNVLRVEGGTQYDVKVFTHSYKSIDDWFLEIFKSRKEDSLPKKTVVKFNGHLALAINDPISYGGCESVYVVFLYKNFVYRVPDSKCSGSAIINTVNSTFKFIEPVGTSSWKTYRNDKYGFEFRYNKELVLDNPAYTDKETSLVGRYIFANKDGFGFGVDIFENPARFELKEWYMKVLNGKEFSVGPGLKTFERKDNLRDELTDDNRMIAISIRTNIMDTIQQRIFFSNGKYIVRLGRSYVSDDTSEYEEGLFKEAVNTFKFIP